MRNNLINCVLVFSLVLYTTVAKSVDPTPSNKVEMDLFKSNANKQAGNLRKAIEDGRLAEKADEALNNLLVSTIGELKKRGHKALAMETENGWRKHRGFIQSLQYSSTGIGDHPAIQWLADIHEKIHFVLGDDICRALRIHDLYIFAYCIPVVFQCVDKVGAIEYERHFIPLVKVISYWLSYAICTGATMGMGGITFLCGLGAMVVEQAVGMFVAPALVDKAYGIFCKDLIVHLPGHG